MLQVEEVRRHSHCLAFSSAGPQSQTYYISYDSYTEHLRWHRTASKVLKVWYECISVHSYTLCFYNWFFYGHINPRLTHHDDDVGILHIFTASCGHKLLIMLSCPSPSICQIASQRVNSVDLSCCSLEELPAQLFYSQDLTHLNLKNNFMSLHKGVPALTRWVSVTNTILCVLEQCDRRSRHMKRSIFLFVILSSGCGLSLCGFFCCLRELPYGLKRKQLRSNDRWRVCGRLCGLDD